MTARSGAPVEDNMLLRDLRGRPVGFLDGDRVRDDTGKTLATVAGKDEDAANLAARAATWMSDRSVLMDLGIGDVAVPSTQADFGIPELECVADYVSPVKYVPHDRGYFFYEDVGDAVKLVVTDGVAAGGIAEVNLAINKTPFTTTGYGLVAKLPRQVVANADFDVKKRVMRRLCEGLRLQREVRIASLLTTAGNWPASNQTSAVAKWNGGVNPAPLTDLFGVLGQSYLPASCLVLPENAAQYFHYVPGSTGAQVRDFVQGGGQLPHICYARAKTLVGGNAKYVWSQTLPTNVVLTRVPLDIETDIPTSMTFRWLGESGVRDGERVQGVLVREFFSSEDDAWWITVAHNDIEVIVSNNVGALIVGALQ